MPEALIHVDVLAEWLCDSETKGELQSLLSEYQRISEGQHLFTGSLFEFFIHQSDSTAFTPWDFLAVGSLSVDVPPRTQYWLLTNPEPAELLTKCVSTVAESGDGSSFTSMTEECESSLADLYDCIRAQPNMGKVTTSKLIAAKFPDLVPIRDDRVERCLGLEKSASWWQPIRTALSTEVNGQDPVDVLDSLVTSVELPAMTNLRKLDAILWLKQTKADKMHLRDGTFVGRVLK